MKKYILTILFCLCVIAMAAQTKQFKALLVTTTRGWHHESLHAGVLAIQQLGVKNYFDVVLFENPSIRYIHHSIKNLGNLFEFF